MTDETDTSRAKSGQSGAEPAERAGGGDPFALQKAMRQRLRAARKAETIAFLDIGSSKIACLLARVDPRGGAPTLIGAGLQRSRGVRLGALADMAEVKRAVRAAVNQAEAEAGERAFHVVANLTGAYPRSHAVSAEIAVSGPRVTDKDMGRALDACRPPHEGEERAILHAVAVNWSIDGESGVRDPKGLAGRRLGVDLHVMTVAEAGARNLAHCLADADLELAALAATPYASGLACLTDEELEDGAACVDLGGGVTSAALFLKGEMVFADLVRLGGEQITLDIVRRLDLPKAEAERLKTLEGSASPLQGVAREPLDLSPEYAARHDGPRPTRADLSAAIRPRVEEVLELARDRLAQAGLFYLPSRRVVLTGGGAQLEGLAEAARAVFGPQVRIGRPIRLNGLPAPLGGPAFATLAGLAGFASRDSGQVWDRAAVKEQAPKGRWGGLFRWLRDTW